jgi:hypothetical protein
MEVFEGGGDGTSNGQNASEGLNPEPQAHSNWWRCGGVVDRMQLGWVSETVAV